MKVHLTYPYIFGITLKKKPKDLHRYSDVNYIATGNWINQAGPDMFIYFEYDPQSKDYTLSWDHIDEGMIKELKSNLKYTREVYRLKDLLKLIILHEDYTITE